MTKARSLFSLRNGQFLFGFCVVSLYIAAAFAAPVLFGDDPLDMVAMPFQWPGTDLTYPLGTDSLGRDLLAGVVFGARASLLVGILSTALAMLLGLMLGAAAGYAGGWVDDLLTRITEMFQTIPPFIFVLVMVAILQPSVTSTTLALTIVSWPLAARLVRAEFRTLRERDFVLAARSLGFSPLRIVVIEILPNALTPLFSVFSVMAAAAILMDAGLAFLGLGDPNVASWGRMIAEGRDHLRSHWYISAVPGLALALVVLGFNALGDGLSDALNPRLRERTL